MDEVPVLRWFVWHEGREEALTCWAVHPEFVEAKYREEFEIPMDVTVYVTSPMPYPVI